MKVGVIGSGTVGQSLSAGFLKHGNQVTLGTRDPKNARVSAWTNTMPGLRVGTFAEAAQYGELLVLAVKGDAVDEAIRIAGPENFAGKTVIDTNNPIANTPPVDGVLSFTTGPNESLAEKIQAQLPASDVVKAFNSVGSANMVNPRYEQGPPTMFLCGNSTAAKEQVSEIIRRFGWEPFDCGTLRAARALEPLCILWCIPGFRSNLWTHAFKLLTK